MPPPDALLLVVVHRRHRRDRPLFYLENTIEKVEGMRPYTPLELAGRNIYIREGAMSATAR
jgi:cbb3-type cytochrome oxidase cytochrome c subunit